MAIVNGEEYAYATEAAARAALISSFLDNFSFHEEVALSTGTVDILAWSVETGWPIAFEIKRGYFDSADYARSLKQAIDYCAASVIDPRLPLEVNGQKLAAVVLFPSWSAGAAARKRPQFEALARGMELLAAKFKVGTGSIDPSHGLTLTMAQGRLWSADRGWGHNAENVLFGKRQKASTRHLDEGLLRSAGKAI